MRAVVLITVCCLAGIFIGCDTTDPVGGDRMFTVSFDPNGGTPVDSQLVWAGGVATEPGTSALYGYILTGWYRDSALTSEWDFHTDVVHGPLTLYAGWSTAVYTVRFNTAGGGPVDSQQIEHGETVAAVSAPSRSGFTFDGWYRDAPLTTSWNFAVDTVVSNVVIYAKWLWLGGSVTDADSNEYTAVQIGNQVWTVQNLRTTRFTDGTPIPKVQNMNEWRERTTHAYCFYNNTADDDTIRTFGALYNWYVADSANPKRVAPQGWRVPSYDDWEELSNYLIANGYNWDQLAAHNGIGKALASTTNWAVSQRQGSPGYEPQTNNRSGFSGQPAGSRTSGIGLFENMGTSAYWWCSSPGRINWWLPFDHLGLYPFQNGVTAADGYSIRLIKD